MKVLAVIAAIFALMIGAGAGGYAWRGDRNQAEIIAAQARANTCEANSQANETTLQNTQRMLADLRERHASAMAFAIATLDARAEEIHDLNAAAEALETKLRELTHEDPDCRALARTPLCAAIARELWPIQAEARAATARPH
jgi:uncharacterized protein HemX